MVGRRLTAARAAAAQSLIRWEGHKRGRETRPAPLAADWQKVDRRKARTGSQWQKVRQNRAARCRCECNAAGEQHQVLLAVVVVWQFSVAALVRGTANTARTELVLSISRYLN